MALFEMAKDEIVALQPQTFARAGVRERDDLQRLIRDQIEIVSPDTLIIAEEFCDWQDSKRRIDLLGVDRQANLVVLELKRSEDGGHMDLQGIRYASMISSMTFERAVDVFQHYLGQRARADDARQRLLDFLEWTTPSDQPFGQDVRIVLVSAEFSKELTTSVLWLNDRDLDIRCVRLRPYSDGIRTLLDIQQVIPLPEARHYLVGLREKSAEARTAQRERGDWEGDWFVNVGMDDPRQPERNEDGTCYTRHWNLCRKFGYVSGGGDPKYWRPFERLVIGSRIFAYQRKAGYVGTGTVTHRLTPLHEFFLADGSRLVDHLSPVRDQRKRPAEKWEYTVGVAWDETVPLTEAKWFPNAFANQNVVCKLRDPSTLSFLREAFGEKKLVGES